MILQPWSSEDLDQREAIAYTLVLRGLREASAAAYHASALGDDPYPSAVNAWSAFVQNDFLPFLADTFTQGAENVSDALGTTPTDPVAVTAYLSSVAGRLAGVGENMWLDIRAALESYDIPDVTYESEVRARKVARTEVAGAANMGAYTQVLASGLAGTKTWQDLSDDRTRTSHQHIGGTSLPVRTDFSVEMWRGNELVGHEDMSIPGDPRASAGNVVDCRCTPVYELEDTLVAATYTTKAKDRKTGKPVPTDKPVYLRVKTLFETDYPDGTVMAVRAESNERIVWDGKTGRIRLEQLSGMEWRETSTHTRGSIMKVRKDEEGWRTPSGTGFKASAPTIGMPITAASEPQAQAQAHTGAMIALIPSDTDLDRLQTDEAREELHMTLAFLGEAHLICPEKREQITEAARAYFTDPVYTEAFGIAAWNPHRELRPTAIVMEIEGDMLVTPHTDMMSAVRGVFDMPQQLTPWRPHMTVAYSDQLQSMLNYTAQLGPITFDKLRIAFGGEHTDFPLSTIQEEIAMEEITTADAFAAPKYAEWQGILTFEGTESGDGRMFALGSLDWAQLPQPLMYQPESVGGHDGSIMVGQINTITRQGNALYGTGIIDLAVKTSTGFELGKEVYRLMSEEFLSGVSVDVDSVSNAEIETIVDPATFAPLLTVFKRGRVRGATLVAFPAFADARLYLTDNLITASAVGHVILTQETPQETPQKAETPEEPLVASSHTITIPDLPPASWFQRPTDVKPTGALTVTDEGRVYGLLAPKNTTHRSRPVTVPTRNVDYSRFMKGETIVDGGGRVVTGVLTMNCGHAPTENYGSLGNRIEHYDNSCSVAANIAIGEHDGEVWVAGALAPFATPDMVSKMLGCSLSGDWQPHPDRQGVREFIAALLVPVPGFAMARTAASVQRYDEGTLVASTIPVMREQYDPFAAKQALIVANLKERKAILAKSLGRDNV